jgi:peptidoglycan/LPS O-acetylase OafA/YrhL
MAGPPAPAASRTSRERRLRGGMESPRPRTSYTCAALTSPKRGWRFHLTRVIAVVCAIGAATLVVCCAVLGYAAATFEHDSLPGPGVLAMVAVGAGLAALLCGGLAHVLWRASKRQVARAAR